MALSFKDRFKYNLYLWYFGLTKVRLINYCRPQIVDVSEKGVTLLIPLNRRTRNHVKSMYIGVMTVGVDLVTGFTAMLKIRESKRNVILIFKDMKANFLKRAEGDVHYICNEGKKIAQAVDETLKTGERVNLLVPVTATVPEKFGDEPVAEFSITLSLKEK
tara:strand:- start:6932 stop:7414 length:483 start_codon:yes stop_codon:yes gene_type:complete